MSCKGRRPGCRVQLQGAQVAKQRGQELGSRSYQPLNELGKLISSQVPSCLAAEPI